MSKEFFIVDSHSELGEQINPLPIIIASRNSDMLSLGRLDFATHPVGFYVTEGLGKSALPVGYIGCKHLFHPSNPERVEEEHALIGSLYLAEQYRGLRLGEQQYKLSTALVGTVTDAVFTRYPNVTTCKAKCGILSASAFIGANYVSGELDSKSGKTSFQVTRQQWQV